MTAAPSSEVGRSTRGAIYIEYSVIFVLLFFAFFYIVQIGISYGSDVVVKYAASRAARAYMTVWDDDDCRYNTEPRRFAGGGSPGGTNDPMPNFMQKILGLAPTGGIGGASTQTPRSEAVYAAASIPLLALAPDGAAGGAFTDAFWTDSNATMLAAVGGLPNAKLQYGANTYNRCFMSVTKRTPGIGSTPEEINRPVNLTASNKVTIRVTYLSYCAIPYASFFFCKTYQEALSAAPELQYSQRGGACSAHVPQMGRFVVLSGESTVTLQPAAYEYEGERVGCR